MTRISAIAALAATVIASTAVPAAAADCDTVKGMMTRLFMEQGQVPIATVGHSDAAYGLFMNLETATWTWTRSETSDEICIEMSGLGAVLDPADIIADAVTR